MILFTPKAKIEKALADWLAHPSELGEAPRAVKYRCSRKRKSFGKSVKIHLVDYEMPDGRKGLGFVGPFAWAFDEPSLANADEEDVLKAYLGLVFVMFGEHAGLLETEFDSRDGEVALKQTLAESGFSNISIGEKFKLDELAVFEFVATKDGKELRGAGNKDFAVYHGAEEPLYHIPQAYVFFGELGET
jgi:hypothetical protein